MCFQVSFVIQGPCQLRLLWLQMGRGIHPTTMKILGQDSHTFISGTEAFAYPGMEAASSVEELLT